MVQRDILWHLHGEEETISCAQMVWVLDRERENSEIFLHLYYDGAQYAVEHNSRLNIIITYEQLHSVANKTYIK